MHKQPVETLFKIFKYVHDVQQIKTLSIVCKLWYGVVNLNKNLCDDFEDFIIQDQIHSYTKHADLFNQYINFMPHVCKPNSNLYLLISPDEKIIDAGLVRHWLVSNGYIKLMKYLYTKEEIIKMYKTQLLSFAIKYDHLNFVEYFCKIIPNINYTKCIYKLAKYGNVNILDYVCSKIRSDSVGKDNCPKLLQKFTIVSKDIIDIAAKHNNINIIKYFLETNPVENIFKINLNHFNFNIHTSCSKQFYLEMIYLLVKYKIGNPINLRLIMAAIRGDLKYIQKIYDKIPEQVSDNSEVSENSDDSEGSEQVSGNNSENSDDDSENSDDDSKQSNDNTYDNKIIVIKYASMMNNLNIVEYMCANQIDFTKYKNTYSCKTEGYFGGYPHEDSKFKKIFLETLRRGNLDIVKYFFEKYRFSVEKHRFYGEKNMTGMSYIDYALVSKNVDLVKFLFEKGFDINQIYDFKLQIRCRKGTGLIPVVKYICKYTHPEEKINEDSYHTIVNSCIKYSNMSNLRYFKNYINDIDDHFYCVIKNKKYDMLKYLYTLKL